MDQPENESQANFFDSTINDSITDSVLPSIDPAIQEHVSKNNNSGLFSSYHPSITGKSHFNHPIPHMHTLFQNSFKDPSLPMIPEPNGATWSSQVEEEEEKVPPPPENLNLSHPTPPIFYNQPDKNLARMLEDDQTISIRSEENRNDHKVPIPPEDQDLDKTKPRNAGENEATDKFVGKVQKYHAVRFGALIKLESLGKGAFGEVFRVFDKDERKFYALKEVKRQNFDRESQFNNTVWIEMRNLMKVHDSYDSELLNMFGINLETEAGVCSFLMELGRGTLHEYNQFRIKNGISWKEDELLSILKQLVRQLDILFTLGVFHRDVKPENIILTDKENKLKLSDLGCAWLVSEGTKSFNIAGTPFFMAPELAQALMNKKKQVEYDPFLGDLFSIGITILRLVQPATKRSELTLYLENKFKEEYPKLYSYVKDLLAKEPEARGKIAKDILEIDIGGLSFTKKEETDYKSFIFQKVVDRSGDNLDPTLYFDMFIFDEAEIIIQNQIVKLKKNEGETLRETEWRIALAQCFIHQRKFEPAFKELDELDKLSQLQKTENENQLIKAKVLFWTGFALASTGKFDDAIKKLTNCLEIRTKILGEEHEDIALVHLRFGYAYYNQGKYEEAHQAFQKCITINTNCHKENTLNVARSYNNIGIILDLQKKYEEAIKSFEKALQIYLNLYGEDYPYVADQYNNIGNIFFGQQKYSEANEHYYKALKIKKKFHGENSPEVALIYGNIASTLDRMFEFNEAIKYMKKSLEIYKAKNVEKNEIAQVYFQIGNTLSRQSKYQESLENHLEALRMLKAYYGEESPHLVENYISCGKVYEILAEISESEQCYATALKLHLNAVGENIKAAQIYKRLAVLLFDAKKFEEASSYTEKAIALFEKFSPSTEKEKCCDIWEILGSKALKENKYDEALEYYEKILAFKLEKFGENYYESGLAYLMIGNVKHKLKLLDQALLAYRKATLILSRVIHEDHFGMGDIYLRIGRLYKDQKKYPEASRDLGRALEIFQKCFPKKHPLIKKCQSKITELNQLYLVQESQY